MTGWPLIRKEVSYWITATHHLRGVSTHPDAEEIHEHCWQITLIFEHWEVRPEKGFTRDEADIDRSFGPRVRELHGKHLNDLMPVPPTSENLAMWLLADWMVNLTPHEENYEIDAIRVSKEGPFVAEARRSQVKKWHAWVSGGAA